MDVKNKWWNMISMQPDIYIEFKKQGFHYIPARFTKENIKNFNLEYAMLDDFIQIFKTSKYIEEYLCWLLESTYKYLLTYDKEIKSSDVNYKRMYTNMRKLTWMCYYYYNQVNKWDTRASGLLYLVINKFFKTSKIVGKTYTFEALTLGDDKYLQINNTIMVKIIINSFTDIECVIVDATGHSEETESNSTSPMSNNPTGNIKEIKGTSAKALRWEDMKVTDFSNYF